MTAGLRAGLRVRLPSGNLLVLVRCNGAEWVCEYLPGSRLRGEVELSAAYLTRFGEVVTKC